MSEVILKKLSRIIYPVRCGRVAIIGWRNDPGHFMSVDMAAELLKRRICRNIYDPYTGEREIMDQIRSVLGYEAEECAGKLMITDDPYAAMNNVRVLIVNLDWIEARVYNWERIYRDMIKPAWVFGEAISTNEIGRMGFSVFSEELTN